MGAALMDTVVDGGGQNGGLEGLEEHLPSKSSELGTCHDMPLRWRVVREGVNIEPPKELKVTPMYCLHPKDPSKVLCSDRERRLVEDERTLAAAHGLTFAGKAVGCYKDVAGTAPLPSGTTPSPTQLGSSGSGSGGVRWSPASTPPCPEPAGMPSKASRRRRRPS
eukprot:TRINITY_DN6073_c0_g1_i1.p1 TRINITY_DN6073_c0_g1~~TRINITY_DN6073_c0_g1_i1.p1  ORF type:complete len:165 (-),score=6.03 TRINITY_DN6073_c0_g1_i1:217-711(-)